MTARGAAEWFARMRGPEADGERAAFEAWRADPANAEAYARLEALWDESRFLANSETGRCRDLARARRKLPPAALLAAGIALLTLMSAGFTANRLGWFVPAATEPATRIAARDIAAGDAVRTVRLADGSRVTLDRGSVLRDLVTPGERHYRLLRGRARFDVAHDPARPFLVDAGAGRVVAHGTVFDVRLEGADARVVLLQGSVEVSGRRAGKAVPGASHFLVAGEQLVVRGGAVGKPSRAGAPALAWADPMIVFDDVPLAEAVTRFNAGGGRAVRFEGQGTTGQRVSGAFRRDDPEGFAAALAASFALEAAKAPDGSILLRPSAAGAP